jgi:hypothetical protein
MNIAAPSRPAGGIDPVTITVMFQAAIAALPVDPGASADAVAARHKAALLEVTALHPRDPVEAMLAARIVSAHHASIACFSRAMQSDVDDAMALRQRARATTLSNLATRLSRELKQLQAAPSAHEVTMQMPAVAPQPPAMSADRARPPAPGVKIPMDPRLAAGSGARPMAGPPLTHPAVVMPVKPADALLARVVDAVVAKTHLGGAAEPAHGVTARAA